jgi:hypothetical protein
MAEESQRKQSTALVPQAVREVQFYEDDLLVALVGDIPYVAVRPIAQFLGLDWSAQYRRLQRDDVLGEEARPVLMTGADGKQREMLSIPLELLPGWLFGITSSKLVKPEYAEKIRRYRRECFRVLWRAFQTELLPATSNQGGANTLLQVRNLGLAVAQLAEQQMELQDQVNTMDVKINQAELAVQDLRQRMTTVEQRVEPHASISEAQATEISNKVRALAEALTQRDKSKNHYQSIFAELYRRFRVSSYKLIKQGQYQAVLKFLDDWESQLGGPKQEKLF